MINKSTTKRTKASIHKASVDDAIIAINLCQSNDDFRKFFGDEHSIISMKNADLLNGALKDDYTSQALGNENKKVKFQSFLVCDKTRERVLIKMKKANEIISNEKKLNKNKKTKEFYEGKYKEIIGKYLSGKIYSSLSIRPTKKALFERKTSASITYLHKELATELSKRSYLFHRLITNTIDDLNLHVNASIDLNPALLIQLLHHQITLEDLIKSDESESISSIKRKIKNVIDNYALMIEALEQKPPPSMAANYLDHTTYSQLHRTSICRIKDYHQIRHATEDKNMFLTAQDIKKFFELVDGSTRRTNSERMIDASKKTGITLTAIQRDCNLQ